MAEAFDPSRIFIKDRVNDDVGFMIHFTFDKNHVRIGSKAQAINKTLIRNYVGRLIVVKGSSKVFQRNSVFQVDIRPLYKQPYCRK